MRFGILGPLRVGGGESTVTAGRDRIVLAMLLLRAGRLVPVDELVDAVWEDRPPATARAQLQTCVSRLRRRFTELGLAPEPHRHRPGGVRRAYRTERPGRRGLHPGVEAARAAAAAGRLVDARDRIPRRPGALARAGARRHPEPQRPPPCAGTRRAAPHRAGGVRRRRAAPRAGRRADRRTRRERRPASAAGAAARPTDAGAVLGRTAGRRARRSTGRAGGPTPTSWASSRAPSCRSCTSGYSPATWPWPVGERGRPLRSARCPGRSATSPVGSRRWPAWSRRWRPGPGSSSSTAWRAAARPPSPCTSPPPSPTTTRTPSSTSTCTGTASARPLTPAAAVATLLRQLGVPRRDGCRRARTTGWRSGGPSWPGGAPWWCSTTRPPPTR